MYKERLSGSETHITGVNADVAGKRVVIYDDMIRTGGSLMQAAQVYHQAGAIEIVALTTHGLFTNLALDKLERQGILKKVISTNTHPNVIHQQNKLFEYKSIANLLCHAF